MSAIDLATLSEDALAARIAKLRDDEEAFGRLTHGQYVEAHALRAEDERRQKGDEARS